MYHSFTSKVIQFNIYIYINVVFELYHKSHTQSSKLIYQKWTHLILQKSSKSL